MSDVLVASPPETESPAEDRMDGGKRRQIIDGARTVFHASGFDAASMNEIARVAGVSKGTLYVYFDSKEALFEALIRLDKRAQAEQTCRLDHDDDDLRTALIGIGNRLLTRLLDPELVAQFRTIVAVSTKFPRIGQAYYEAGPAFGMRKLAAYLRKQDEAGLLAITDFDLAAHHFGDLCKSRHLFRAIMGVGEQPTPDEIARDVEQAVDVFLRAYAPQTGQCA